MRHHTDRTTHRTDAATAGHAPLRRTADSAAALPGVRHAAGGRRPAIHRPGRRARGLRCLRHGALALSRATDKRKQEGEKSLTTSGFTTGEAARPRTVCPGCLWAAWGAPDRAICSRAPCARRADTAALAAARAARGPAAHADEKIKKEGSHGAAAGQRFGTNAQENAR